MADQVKIIRTVTRFKNKSLKVFVNDTLVDEVSECFGWFATSCKEEYFWTVRNAVINNLWWLLHFDDSEDSWRKEIDRLDKGLCPGKSHFFSDEEKQRAFNSINNR